MAKLATTLPQDLRDVAVFKGALETRRSGKSLAEVSEKHYRNKTNLPAHFRKCREIVANPDASKEDKPVAKRILELWKEASDAAGKRVGNGAAALTPAASKEMLAALKDC